MIKVKKQAYFESQGIGNSNTIFIVPFVSIRLLKHQLNYLRIVIYLRSSAPITNEDRIEIEFNDIKEMNRQLECYREYLNLTLNKALI